LYKIDTKTPVTTLRRQVSFQIIANKGEKRLLHGEKQSLTLNLARATQPGLY